LASLSGGDSNSATCREVTPRADEVVPLPDEVAMAPPILVDVQEKWRYL